mgnify:CR=1 FL=1
MHHQKIVQLIKALEEIEVAHETDFNIPFKRTLIEGKGQNLLSEAYNDLNGAGDFPLLNQLKLDLKIGKFLFLFDDAYHFNRYRLKTLKADIYDTFSFSWHGSYLRMCRTFERECLLSGSQERIWYGPPIASRCFGKSENPPDLSGNGASGWKLNAYNDLQYDLISRLLGYKLVRISAYENLMIGGKLLRIDKLLLRPSNETLKSIGTWLIRKMD